MRILVTGANGFLGSHIPGIPLLSNIENPISLKEEIKSKSDGHEYVVVHCAALTDVAECEANPKQAFEVNVRGTRNVLEAIDPERGKFILLSSCHVFSGKKYFPYSEKHSPDPINVYGITKYGAEAYMSTYPNSLVLRVGKVYDESWIDKIMLMQEAVPSFIVRNFIYMDDFVGIMHIVIDKMLTGYQFPRFNALYDVLHIGNPHQNFSYNLFYNLVRDEYERVPLPKRSTELEDMAPRPHRCALNVGQMQKMLGKGFTFRSL